MNKYYSLVKTKSNEADINIFGDITSFPYLEGDTSSIGLVNELKSLGDVSKINVHINSYGGEVAEGLAIYNTLKNHKAKVITYCDGFACSIASIIFMAGDERIMNKSSLLMIHNAWTIAQGNANELRKQAEDLEKITEQSVKAYMEYVNISEEELKALLDEETWVAPEESLEKGFATSIKDEEKTKNANQSAKNHVIQMILASKDDSKEDSEDDSKEDSEDDSKEDSKEDSEEDSSSENTENLDSNDTEDDTEDDTEEESKDKKEKEKNKKEESIKEKNIKFFSALI